MFTIRIRFSFSTLEENSGTGERLSKIYWNTCTLQKMCKSRFITFRMQDLGTRTDIAQHLYLDFFQYISEIWQRRAESPCNERKTCYFIIYVFVHLINFYTTHHTCVPLYNAEDINVSYDHCWSKLQKPQSSCLFHLF